MDDCETIAAKLIAAARGAAAKAHAPYSGFHVGCAILARDGTIATGVNVENACYRLGLCAEQAALAAAQQTFGLGQITHVAVAGGRMAGDALRGSETVTPCGGCRQAIAEAAALSGTDIAVICAPAEGGAATVQSIAALLPAPFAMPREG